MKTHPVSHVGPVPVIRDNLKLWSKSVAATALPPQSEAGIRFNRELPLWQDNMLKFLLVSALCSQKKRSSEFITQCNADRTHWEAHSCFSLLLTHGNIPNVSIHPKAWVTISHWEPRDDDLSIHLTKKSQNMFSKLNPGLLDFCHHTQTWHV